MVSKRLSMICLFPRGATCALVRLGGAAPTCQETAAGRGRPIHGRVSPVGRLAISVPPFACSDHESCPTRQAPLGGFVERGRRLGLAGSVRPRTAFYAGTLREYVVAARYRAVAPAVESGYRDPVQRIMLDYMESARAGRSPATAERSESSVIWGHQLAGFVSVGGGNMVGARFRDDSARIWSPSERGKRSAGTLHRPGTVPRAAIPHTTGPSVSSSSPGHRNHPVAPRGTQGTIEGPTKEVLGRRAALVLFAQACVGFSICPGDASENNTEPVRSQWPSVATLADAVDSQMSSPDVNKPLASARSPLDAKVTETVCGCGSFNANAGNQRPVMKRV